MKNFLYIFLIAFISLVISSSGFAQTRIQVKGAGSKYPISMPTMCNQDDDSGVDNITKNIPAIVLRALDYSGYFSVIKSNQYLETPGKCGQDFAYSDWSIINSDALIKGSVLDDGVGVTVRLFLHDVPRQTVVMAKEYRGSSDQVTAIAKRFANEVIGYFTGKKGVFGSKIAFSSKIGRFKELFVVNMDGTELTQLTYDKALALSPSFSPRGSYLTFTSYRNRVPDIFEYDFSNASFRQVTRSKSLEIGAKYTENDKALIASVSHGRESDLALFNRDGKIINFITRNNGILEVSPVLSPNQKQIAFVANRSGGPQVYTMEVNGENVKRISYVNSKYCTSPDWSKATNKLAFVCRADGGFQIFTSDADGKNPFQVTSIASNEDPSFSPDGRHLVFATTYWQGSRSSLAMVQVDGSNLKRLTVSRSGDTDPDWGPVS